MHSQVALSPQWSTARAVQAVDRQIALVGTATEPTAAIGMQDHSVTVLPPPDPHLHCPDRNLAAWLIVQ